MADTFDLAVVGAGVMGLAHALAAARAGRRVVVIDRDARANGASARMSGLVTVAGHAPGQMWRRAKRSREVWAEVCAQASVRIEHEGLAIVARRPEAATTLEAFAATEGGAGSSFYLPDDAHALFPQFKGDIAGVFWSPDELRVEPRSAMAKIASWLEEAHGVAFRWETAVIGVEDGEVSTSRGPISAEAAVVCAGDDFRSLFAERLSAAGLTRVKSQMLRVRLEDGYELPGAVASDLAILRLPGFEELDGVAALRARLEAEQPECLANGVVCLVSQSADGSLVVSGSRQADPTPDPFQSQAIDDLILGEFEAVLGKRPKQVTSRWIGTYAFSSERPVIVDAPSERVRVVVAASAAGASSAFAVAEETIAGLFGKG
ncbi:TIGR03364 family FAD-dependent oxidoreductase [Chenggangzhangella methanolivorans]|uniref:TIGR03364 family FAD-dependent oxidoreductase n=1 Tax=Chenggangzhangella methanolivorans TaxID=1437009 RepID=A0A9E6R7C5_9HYPH|nr:TIGR03364 family FAD-dependent oxidoreductase [Chenggangzhangella methanolivorans]QZN99184.1 TIGR03364 family FAD-dependent oxidoreductase [Chenggangzhangella methanolivorans]